MLCNSRNVSDYFKDEKHYFLECNRCSTVFRHPETWITASDEKKRYLAHHNDVEDTGYQNYVNPLIEVVLHNFPNTALGLDFGAGTGPVAAKLLRAKGYQIALYDPFFHRDEVVLEKKYDFIICCEVMEHFHFPISEFKLLKTLLKPNGKLFCTTNIWKGTTKEFESWWYKNDSTHTLFYNLTNLKIIQESCNFKEMTITARVIELK